MKLIQPMKPAVAVIFIIVMLVLAIYLTPSRPKAQPKQSPTPPPAFWRDDAFRAALDASGARGRAGITVVAPGSGLGEESLAKAREIASALGVRFSDGAVRPGVVPYHAATDGTRLDEFRRALADPETEVLWALRGGYGSGRLLAALAGMPKPASPKVFIGYSDMTFLHLFLQNWGWRTVHGAMFWELHSAGTSRNPENFHRLARLLSGEAETLEYAEWQPLNRAAETLGAPVEGVIVGGNLTCLAAAVGTPWALDAGGKMLFAEEVGEPGYRVDRLFTQLRDAGALDGVRAVLLGEFTAGDEATEFAVRRFADSLGVPVLQSKRFGHGRDNFPMLFNSPARIEKGEGGYVLSIKAGALP